MIRPATVADFPTLENLLGQILQVHHQARPDLFKAEGQKFSRAELVALLDNPKKPIFVYEGENGEILGHLFCQLREENSAVQEPIKTLFIDDLCVDEAARGQKIGQQLYAFAEDLARKEKCYNLTLNVWNDNEGATRFYENLGMKAQVTTMERIL